MIPRKIKLRPRVLVVEDDHRRFEAFERYIQGELLLVPVTSAVAAKGLLERTKPEDYAGVMFDYDLEKVQTLPPSKLVKNGLDVAKIAARVLSKDTEVLVHSMSVDRAKLVTFLRAEGFPTEQLPYADCTRETLAAFCERVKALHEDRMEE